MNVVFREEALTDLEEIADYVSQQNPQVAARTIARIHRVIYRRSARCPSADASIQQTVPASMPFLACPT
jgi:plasmid stabilization system protein ParE